MSRDSCCVVLRVWQAIAKGATKQDFDELIEVSCSDVPAVLGNLSTCDDETLLCFDGRWL